MERYDPEDAEMRVPVVDGGDPVHVLYAVLACARCWEPGARIIGNVRAGDIARAVTYALTAMRRLELADAAGTAGDP